MVTNLHIYRYPGKVFFQPESSSFSEANRLANLTQQPNLPSRKTCTCKNKALRFLCLYSLGIAVYQPQPFMLLDRPGVFTGPLTNHMEGSPAQAVDLDQWRAVVRACREHLPQGLPNVVSPLAANRFERTPHSRTTTRGQDDDAREQRGRP